MICDFEQLINIIQKLDSLGNKLWFLIIFFVIQIIIQFFFQLNLNKKIEKYKNDLDKKSIKFSKHSEMQIECLKNMYNNIVDLDFSIHNLTNHSFDYYNLKSNIEHFYSVYNSNMDYFHRNKILLNNEIINQIIVIEAEYKKLEKSCQYQLDVLLEIEDELQFSGGITEIKKSVEVIKIPANILKTEIERIRFIVENYFKSLTT